MSVVQLNKPLLNAAFDNLLNVAFNAGMNDAELIAHLGGPAKLSELLNYEKHGGVQRVQNWISRGIPSKVKVDHPEIFLSGRPIGAATEPTPQA